MHAITDLDYLHLYFNILLLHHSPAGVVVMGRLAHGIAGIVALHRAHDNARTTDIFQIFTVISYQLFTCLENMFCLILNIQICQFLSPNVFL